jgi:ATP-dependent DNA ligase
MPIMPEWLEPMAATLTEERFAGPDWSFERKFDGIRLIAYKRGADVQLYSRNRLPQNLPAVADALPVDEVILDGEITWDLPSGYHVFDILWLNGRSVTALPLEERRALLEALPFTAPVQRVEELDDDAPWERARREGWEGVIAKRRGSPYEHRRSKLWLKMDLRRRLDAIEVPTSLFTKATGLPRLRAHWVRPHVVVQVAFIEWTVHGKLRHPRLIGVRFDKDPRAVTREDA